MYLENPGKGTVLEWGAAGGSLQGWLSILKANSYLGAVGGVASRGSSTGQGKGEYVGWA